MKAERMVKLRVLAPKNKLSLVINELYDLGLCHIYEHKKDELDIGTPLAEAEILSELLLKMRQCLQKYPESALSDPGQLDASVLDETKKEILGIVTESSRLEQERDRLSKEIVALEEENLKRSEFEMFNVPDGLDKSNKLSYFYGTLEGSMETIQKKFSEVVGQVKSEKVLLICQKNIEEEVFQELQKQGYKATEVGDTECSELTIRLSELLEKQRQLEVLSQTLRKEIPKLQRWEKQFSEEIKKQELPLSFAVTGKTFVAEGWVPRKSAKLIEDKLSGVAGGVIHIEISQPERKESPPIRFKNKNVVSPFEFFLRLYDLPKYSEIDPTSLMFITFPLFFGFMLGDLGYGLVLFGVFYWLKKKVPAARELAKILMFAALVSAIFGGVFGEFFGFEHLSEEKGEALCGLGICLERVVHISHGQESVIYEFPRLFNRVHDEVNIFGYEILSILVIGAMIGFIHLNLGFLLGFINEYQAHGLKHAIYAKVSWVLIELGVILAILSAVEILIPVMLPVGIGIGISGVILLGIGEGVQGLVEMPALISNTLSYMRLGAVGLASVGLAIVVNENLALPMISKGGPFILIGVVIMILGHAVNILLGLIGPFLHSVRLHYVEFFSKFFHGGGVEFKPFGED
jgi:V/A-type H+/Na+-transporting ATPase subunit I